MRRRINERRTAMTRETPVRSITIIGIVALMVLFGTCAGARDLTVTAWGGASQAAAQKVYFKPFVDKTGIKLQEDSWSGGIGVLRTKVQGGNASWDVVQVEVDELILGCEEGLFEKLDWSRLGGKDKFLAPAVSDCGVGAVVWANALGYDGDRLQDGPKSWADSWDVKKFPGKRGMRKGAKYTLEIALLADGVKPQDVYKVLGTSAGADRAFKKLDELKPSIIWWTNVSQVPDMLASGEVTMSVITAARLLAAFDSAALKAGLRRAERSHKLHAIVLVAPLLLFLALNFVLPIGSMLLRSIQDPEFSTVLPETAALLRDSQGGELPDDRVVAV